MNYVKIGDIATITSGGTPNRQHSEYFSNGKIPWIKTGDLKSKYIKSWGECISEEGLSKSSAKLFPINTVLVAMYGATIGACGILTKECATNQACGAILPSKHLHPEFTYYYLLSIKPQLIGQGVGGAQPNISGQKIKDTKIPLLPLPEQRRIATLLEKADELRKKRAESIHLADEFIKSVFLEMFGNPVRNQKGFPMGTIRDLVKQTQYGSSQKAGAIGKYPILRMNNLTYDGNWNFTDLKYIDLQNSEVERYTVHKGDILFNRTNSRELVGKAAVYREENTIAYAGYLIRVRTNENAHPEYISAFLNSAHGKTKLLGMCKSIIGMANINAQELLDIPILIPPTILQNRFATIVQEVICLRNKLKSGNDYITSNFNSLLQRAFHGEL